ncbi:helix-turn-helix domain-containing protein [Megasphaera stantonii]|uniref:helix-turn-helix domain-containing protein n=1 Tax=Megasphaera stantonii TaxID=2144175 RepID=UPI0023F36196|nr:helix-turn-helix transcriptional regulator [Megasphaera stantonii]
MLKDEIGQRLKRCRLKRKYSQEHIAVVLNCSQASYALYESGKRMIPIEKLIVLAKYYKVSTDYFLGIRLRNLE